MPEKFLAAIPFLTLGAAGKMHLNTSRVIEAVIIAAIAGTLGGYITLIKMDVSFEYMEKHMTESIERIERKVDKVIADIYKPHVGEHE